jgi:hypothetical protein
LICIREADSYDRIAGFVHGRGEGRHASDYGVESVDLHDRLDALKAAVA